MFTKLDGGLSTALENNGNKLTTSLWTGELIRTAPAEITKAHLDFINAGSEIIITSSYQLSYLGCQNRGWTETETSDALRASTQLAKDAVNKSAKDVKVAASVGPYGAALADGSEYKGNYGLTKSALRDFHAKRLEVLIATSPDLLALETMPDTFEVEVLLELLNDCPIPFWVSYSCKSGNKTNAGQNFADAVSLVKSAIAVGINCTAPELVTKLLLSANSDIPFVVYPNSGRIWNSNTKEWEGNSSAGFNDLLVESWISAGAQFIGGCCGVGADEILSLSLR
ncbi:MAG: homocysteine S-methyltransferase [Actinomycetes bacterium]|jgi:homocysteine S-methyltransferase